MDKDQARRIIDGELELMGAEEISQRVGVSRRTLDRWVKPGNSLAKMMSNLDPEKFPRPDLYIGNSPKWTKDTVILWLQENSSPR